MAKRQEEGAIVVRRPNIERLTAHIVGLTQYVQHRFSEKQRQMMLHKHVDPTQRAKKTRDPKDVDALYRAAMYMTADGRNGIPAAAFRNAMIDACRLAGLKMTEARMTVFVEHDGIDVNDGTPLVYINGTPEPLILPTRNQTGVADIRVRPCWRTWSAELRIAYDADQINAESVANLLLRAGLQVGVGEGRPFSKKSAGMGWGTFTLEEQA
ncbi:MAG TPA: hypothetical protein VNL98_06775 [Gemmatimonadales bacterium]|nr:hypothetical protein [Gemmatimonadales bacterium]